MKTLYRAKRGPRIEACAEDVDDERAELFDSRSSDCGDVVGFRRRDLHSAYSSDLIWVRNSLIGGVNYRIDLLLVLRGVIQLMSGRKSVTRRWCSLKADKSIRDWQSTSIEPAFIYARLLILPHSLRGQRETHLRTNKTTMRFPATRNENGKMRLSATKHTMRV